MSRGALLVVFGLVPLIRAVGEGLDAAVELSQMLRPGRAVIDVGGWEVGALFGRHFGLGAVGSYEPYRGIAEPQRTEAIVYLGPLTFTAIRDRIPEVAPLVGREVAA